MIRLKFYLCRTPPPPPPHHEILEFHSKHKIKCPLLKYPEIFLVIFRSPESWSNSSKTYKNISWYVRRRSLDIIIQFVHGESCKRFTVMAGDVNRVYFIVVKKISAKSKNQCIENPWDAMGYGIMQSIHENLKLRSVYIMTTRNNFKDLKLSSRR